MRQRVYFFYILLLLLSACEKSTVEDLLQTDREFSTRSEEVGMQTAFLEFADDKAVLLRANTMPIRGKDAIISSFKTFSDEGIILTWEPLAGEISRSADLGYTYGLYTLTAKADSSQSRGKYVSIWKKQEDGSWKFVLDGGNEGI